MLDFFWFLVAVIFFILFLSKKSSAADDKDYRHGYWDGYRALGSKIQTELDAGGVKREQLEEFIAAGYPDSVQPGELELELELESENEPKEQWQPAETTVAEPVLHEPAPEQREQKTTRNLNAILYVASFLLVAAAAVFVAASMPAEVRLLGIWAVVVLFYIAGLVLHQKVPRLQPAALAFAGTGLAIIPFAGYALHLIGDMPGQSAWWITSVIGLIAYFFAAVVLRSQLVSYLTMAFVLSLGLSSVAVVSAPIVWYFVTLIAVALLASTISYLKPTWLPELFRRPVETTGQTVTPIALLASLVLYDSMTLSLYEVVFGIATAHYLVSWLQGRSWLYETIVRLLLHTTLLLIAFDISGRSVSTFALYWLIFAALQVGYSLLRLGDGNVRRPAEIAWLSVMQGVILFGTVLWIGSEHAAAGTLASFATLGVSSILVALRLRQVLWAIPALAASLITPFIVGRWLAQPVWDWQVIAWIFILLAASATAVYYVVRAYRSPNVLRFLQVSFWLYAAFSLFTVIGQLNLVTTGIIVTITSLLIIAFSYCCRQASAELVGGMVFIIAVASLLADTTLGVWYITTVILVVMVGLYGVTCVHQAFGEVARRNLMLGLCQVMPIGLLLNFWMEKQVLVVNVSLLLVAAAGAFALRVITQQKSAALQHIFSFSYMAYIVLAWLLSSMLEPYWGVMVFGLASALFWAGSYVERAQGLVIVGNITLTATIATLWTWLELRSDWMALGVTCSTAAILYLAYMLLDTEQNRLRQRICLVSVWVLLGIAGLLSLVGMAQPQEVAGAGALLALAATIALHGQKENNRSTIELSIYLATFAAQRMVGVLVPELQTIFYMHWWAATIGLVVWWREGEKNLKTRLIIAVAFITAGSGFKALEEGGGYQLLFLVEHTILLVVGALRQVNWALWWGIAAVVLAVLYFLRDYPYMALAFLGLVLIAIVIWRLIRSGREHKDS